MLQTPVNLTYYDIGGKIVFLFQNKQQFKYSFTLTIWIICGQMWSWIMAVVLFFYFTFTYKLCNVFDLAFKVLFFM